MNLNTLFEEPTLTVRTIVSHLFSHFGFQPGRSMELVLILGKGSERSPKEALQHWVIEQCRMLRDDPPEYPLHQLEDRLRRHLLDYGLDLSEITVPSQAARRIRCRLPNPDLAGTIAEEISRGQSNLFTRRQAGKRD